MMCDLENSYSDENGLPSEECLRALQNVDVKECYLQDCPGTKIYALSHATSSFKLLHPNSPPFFVHSSLICLSSLFTRGVPQVSSTCEWDKRCLPLVTYLLCEATLNLI